MLGMTMPISTAARHLLGIGEPDDLVEGIGLGLDLFDCAVPTRLARHGMALAPLAEKRFRFDVRGRFAADDVLVEDCPCATCAAHSRPTSTTCPAPRSSPGSGCSSCTTSTTSSV